MSKKKSGQGKASSSGSGTKRGGARKLVGDIRQLGVHPAFRIDSQDWFLKWLETKSPARTAPQRQVSDTEREAIEARTKDLVKAVAGLVSGLWRVRKNILSGGQMETPQQKRRVVRAVESAWDAMASHGIEAKDYSGEKYAAGAALKVIVFQQAQDVTVDTIAETVKPTIFFKDALIQRGEVVVSTPAQGAPEASRDAAAPPGHMRDLNDVSEGTESNENEG